MTFVAAKCPQCGGDLQLDPEKETGFCMHCGSKIVVHDAIRAVRIDNTHMVNTWMNMGDLATESGNHQEAYEYYTKICEVQPDNSWAIFKKGKSAGWQSTLAHVRFTESAICFAKAIELSPEGEKQKVIDESTEEIKKYSSALITLRAKRFIKWPDQDEVKEILSDIDSILNAVNQLANKSGVIVSGYMEPVATIINHAVIAAWSGKILPDYQCDENHPGKSEFDQFLERIGYCTILLEKAISLSTEDDEKDIQRYENLILLNTEALKSCSWKQNYNELGTSWAMEYQLSDSSKKACQDRISQYKTKISQIKDKKRQQEEAERLENDKKTKGEAKKRYDDYWSGHTSEEAQLEIEKIELSEQINSLENERDTVTSQMHKENEIIKARIVALCEEQKALGLFKGNEKKNLQAQIDESQNDLATHTHKLNNLQKSIIVKIEDLKIRIIEIDKEQTKAR